MEPPSSHAIAIVNESGRRAPRALISRAVATTLDQHGSTGDVSILLCDDAAIRDMNRRYRGIDEATDVLSFVYEDRKVSGDIAISLPYAERQARARRVSLSQELGYLAIHGVLHLLGFDDEREADRAEMIRQMNRAAVAAGLEPDDGWGSILHGAHSA